MLRAPDPGKRAHWPEVIRSGISSGIAARSSGPAPHGSGYGISYAAPFKGRATVCATLTFCSVPRSALSPTKPVSDSMATFKASPATATRRCVVARAAKVCSFTCGMPAFLHRRGVRRRAGGAGSR